MKTSVNSLLHLIFVLFLIICATVSGASASKVWNVSAIPGSGNVTSLLEIPLIDNGDTIRIWGVPGHTYEGGITINASDVTVKQWEGSPVRPVITNISTHIPAIYIRGSNVTLQGLNISDNRLSDGYDGAGIKVLGKSNAWLEKVTIISCTFTGNMASGSFSFGGALFAKNVNNISVEETEFRQNSADKYGGAIYFENSACVTVINTTFISNTGSEGGGAYFLTSSDISVINTSFIQNKAYFNGGGAFFSSSPNAVATNTSFIQNVAYKYGGGSYFTESSNFIIQNCLFNNSKNIFANADAPGYSWGGILNYATLTTGKNIADGPYLGGNVWLTDPAMNISENCTDSNYDGICDGTLTIVDSKETTFGTDDFPLVYNTSSAVIWINSTPAGAYVFVDGANTTRTTNNSFYIPEAEHTISVKLPGYIVSPREQAVTISSTGPNDSIEFTLTPIIIHPTIWNVSMVSGSGNYTNISTIPEIGEGDTLCIWGVPGHTYEGGITIDEPDLTIKQWDGSPVRPVITASPGMSGINITADNATLQGLNISGNMLSGSNAHGAGVNAFGTEAKPLEKLTINACTFTGNELSGSGSCGSGLTAKYVNSILLNKADFCNNTANQYGGGCYFYSSHNATVTDTSYTNNTANAGGGCYFTSSNHVTIRNVSAQDNMLSDFSSAGNCIDITFSNLTLNEENRTRVSFTCGGDLNISGPMGEIPDEPVGYCDVGHYVKVKAPGWIFLNISYEGDDVEGLHESSLSMWNHTNGKWSEVPGTNGVNTAEKYVYANLTGVNDWNVVASLTNVAGELRINSSPEGGWIWLDGVNRSVQTNSTIRGIVPDVNHNVTVVLPGYYGQINELVNISNYGSTDVFFNLKHETGILQINSTPLKAAIYLNGALNSSVTNTTLHNLDTGIYNVTVLADNYAPGINTCVNVEKGVTTVVSFDLVHDVGNIQVNSRPACAAIYLDGTDTGTITNSTLSNLATGIYNVTVLADNYAPGINTCVNVEKGVTTVVSFDLVHDVGNIQVNSRPACAAIYLDGTDTGTITNSTLSNLATGIYNVAVLADNCAPGINTCVNVEKGVTTVVSFDLVHDVGNIQVNSRPACAAIYLDGTDTGTITNSTLSDLDTGVYNVTVLLDDYAPGINTCVSVEKGVTTVVSFDLVHDVGNIQVNSRPACAAIYLDGTDTGTITNSTLSDLDTGVYNVTVLLDDYAPGINTSVQVLKDGTTDAFFDLKHEIGILQINSTPPCAAIFLNGTDTNNVTNTTLSDLTTGVYNVSVLLDNYAPGINPCVNVEKGVTTVVSFDLVHDVGNIQVNSRPACAAIYLDGTDTGNITNTTLSDLATGVYNVTVLLDNYAPGINQTVVVEKGVTTEVLFDLIGETGSIQVNSTPANAGIWLDGNYTGKSTNIMLRSIPTGIHTITVVKPNYITMINRSVIVKTGEVTDALFALTQQTGMINISSSPADAWIWLDGVNRSVKTNKTLDNISAGSHEIRLVKPLYYNVTNESVKALPNQTTDVVFNLIPTGSKPIPSFTATPLSGEAPLRVTFTDTSNGDPRMWNWSFGDGNFSEEKNPFFTYTKEGVYDVSLITGNLYGNSTIINKDYITVSSMPAVRLYGPSGRIPVGGTVKFPVEADDQDNITELNFVISYDPELITVENVAPGDLVQDADFDTDIDNTNGLVTVSIIDDSGITAGYIATIADITFRATDRIEGLRDTVALNITHADAGNGVSACPVIRTDSVIDVEARAAIDAHNGTLPVESSGYLMVNTSGLNGVENVLLIMAFNRTVISVTNVRANDTLPDLAVDSVINNNNGWLLVNVAAPDTITTEEPVSLVDINMHSKGLPSKCELRLINILWTRDNSTYSFDDMHSGYINITPVETALKDKLPVSVENLTFNDDTRQVAINVSENRNAAITDENMTILIKNPGIDITIHSSGLNLTRSSEWNGTCTGAEIGNISSSVELSGDVGMVNTGIDANISGCLSALTSKYTALNISVTRGVGNESVGRLFQLAVREMGAELEEVAYTLEINKSAMGGITVSDATIVMTAPVRYVNRLGGADNFSIISMADDSTISVLKTSNVRKGDDYIFTALSPDGFSAKSLVVFSENEDPVAEFSAVPDLATGDAPLYVQFCDYSAGHPYSWLWDFGDGKNSTEQMPGHTYFSPGVYDVTLSITNVNGVDSVEKTRYITVTNPMKVDFVASRNTGYEPFEVKFSDRTEGNPQEWLWEFGDGHMSNRQNPVHTYRSSGTYAVSLTAINEYGTVTARKAGFISVSPNGNDGDSYDDDGSSSVLVMPTSTRAQITVTPTLRLTVTETTAKTPWTYSTVQVEIPVTTGVGEPSTEAGSWLALWLRALIIIALIVVGVMLVNRRNNSA